MRFELAALLLATAISADSSTQSTDWKSKIKNVVILVEENRSFDNIFGDLTYNKNIDSLANKGIHICNPSNITASTTDNVLCGTIDTNVEPNDPNHSISGNNMELFGTFHPDEAAIASGQVVADMQGYLTEQLITYSKINSTTAAREVLSYYSADDIPVMSTLAENFVLFDRWFCAVPGPTNPNRAYLTSGTSYGHGSNDVGFTDASLPVRSIFQQLTENKITWKNYQNSTTGVDLGFNPDSMFYTWTLEHAGWTNVFDIDQFYEDAKAGKLPQFTYINPECCSYDSFHPASPVSTSEGFVSSIYEALRNSPQWEETLFILTFDENGGFADHVPPPVNVPKGDNLTYSEVAHDGKSITFSFDRLGVRVPTILISPWVGKGVVETNGTDNGGVYSHTSILAFLQELWSLDNGTPLTPRVGWSSTFEHLILDKIRHDTPSNLPRPASNF